MARDKKTKLKNPFVNQGYIGPEYFCDRQQETELMLNHFENGRNITLVAPRRIGKTGLIKHLFFLASAKSSVTAITCAKEVSFTSVMTSFALAGTTRLTTCGRIMR